MKKKYFEQQWYVMPFILAGALTASHNVMADSTIKTKIQTPNGVVIGDVKETSAVLWSRADRNAEMEVKIHGKHHGKKLKKVTVYKENDYTGHINLEGLKAGTEYDYSVSFKTKKGKKSAKSETMMGSFTTAPEKTKAQAVKFAWGGDVAGQNVCRDVNYGFPAFKVMGQQQWDFFIGLGDMIYADGTCEPVGRFGNAQIPGAFTKSADLKNYWAHWSYSREDDNMQKVMATTPYIAVWDDHEVVNDFGPLHDTREGAPYTAGEHLLPIGLKAFQDYNPMTVSADTPDRLYRNIRWGQHVELFILDTRQYRDANFMPDDENAPKSMLGREQLVWLKDKLATSDATWKVIVSSVPMSIPTGFPPEGGRDGWADYDQDGGFEYELTDILRFMQKQGIKNSVWLTTDVHFSEGFSYQPFADAPEFETFEFVSGPLNAGVFPNENFDTTLSANRLFFHGAPAGINYQQAQEYFTFGAVEVSANGDMTVQIVNAKGDVVAEQHLPMK